MAFEIVENANGQEIDCKVVGIGGGGCNAVDCMIREGGLVNEYIAIDRDTAELRRSKAGFRIMLGTGESGAAAQAQRAEIRSRLAGAEMVFIVTGMGGGTGTGAAPIVADIARELGALTIAVVGIPFAWEGEERIRIAEAGLLELQKHVDTLFVVRNDKVKEMAMPGDGVSREDMFQAADHLLCDMVRDIAWSTREPKMIAIDFQDMRYILGGMNRGAVGVGSATGADRARLAAEHALASPLLKDTDLSSVRGALIELRASSNLEMREAKETLSILRNGLPDAFTIYDFFMDEDMQDELRVIVIFITPLDEVRRQEVESQ